MFIQQEFQRKNKVTNRYSIEVDLNNINFLQAYFVNKFQLEVNQEVEISLDVINDILDRINRVIDNNELAIELLPTLETLSRIVEVEAFDEEEARDTVEDEYKLQKIILTADDFECVEFNNL